MTIQCRFNITRIVYENIKEGKEEGWNIAEGDINIRGSNVEFGINAKWQNGWSVLRPNLYE